MDAILRRLVRIGSLVLRQRGRSAVTRAFRLTGASTAAYVVAEALLPDTVPVLAPLTALLVVEVTLFDILTSGIQRVVSVVAGVMLAVGFSSWVHFSWWSLAALVATSILLGQLLRLGPHLLEVPISAMLVLAVGGAETAALDRITETLIGAAVGVGANLVFPPAIRSATAAAAVEKFGEEIARLLESAAAELSYGITTDEVTRWLEDARRLSRHVPRIDRALEQAEKSRRLNPRALLVPDSHSSLRGGLDALEHSSVAVRSMFRSMLDGVEDHRELAVGEDQDDQLELRLAFAELLRDLAATVRAFGELVRASVAESTEGEEAALTTALEALRETRAKVTDLQLVGPRDDLVAWELNAPLLDAVERLLGELDVEEQARRRAGRQHAVHLYDIADPRPALKAAGKKLRRTGRRISQQSKGRFHRN